MKALVSALLLLLALVGSGFGQPAPAKSTAAVPLAVSPPATSDKEALPPQEAGKADHTTREVALSIAVLVFGAVLFLLEVLVMLRRNASWDGWAFKITGLTLIVTAGLFLVVAGYSLEQITPVVGILGTALGFLFGREARREASGGGDGATTNTATAGGTPRGP